MKKISIFVSLVISIFVLTGCTTVEKYDYTYLDVEINEYGVYNQVLKDGPFCKALPTVFKIEESFETERRFMVSCADEGIVIKVDDNYYLLEYAVKEGLITTDQILYTDLGESANKDRSVCLTTTYFDEDYVGNHVGSLNGYEIYRTNITCEMFVGGITVDGYFFGFISSGCTHDLDSIGYYAMKDDVVYELQTLVDDGEMTTKDIYERIYCCDENRLGYLPSITD